MDAAFGERAVFDVLDGFVDDFVEQATNVRNSKAMRNLFSATLSAIGR